MVSVKGVLVWSQKVWMVSTDIHHIISRTVHISPQLLFSAWRWVWKIIKIQEHGKALTFWISHPAIFSRERVFDDCIREVTANTPFSSSSTPRISSSVKLIPSAKNVSNAPLPSLYRFCQTHVFFQAVRVTGPSCTLNLIFQLTCLWRFC